MGCVMVKGNYTYYKVWEKYCGKKPRGFDLHHIDGNRSNNAIENLLLLPRKLHNDYHNIKNNIKHLEIDCEIRSILDIGNKYYEYIFNLHEQLHSVLRECNKWADYKEYLLGNIPNIHNINLE